VDRNSESRYTSAALAALERFPVDAESVELVAWSENVTFRVPVRGGDTDFVLRLHRPGYTSLEELESEHLWLGALKETGVAIPAPVATRQGDRYVLVDIPGTDEQRYAGMATWYRGSPLRRFLDDSRGGQERARVFRRFGEIAAIFHNQATAWPSPEGFTRRRLGLDELLGDEPFWGRFWEHPALSGAERRLMLRARARMRESLAEYGELQDRFSLIHADFTPDNIIYDGEDLAVIDFDDSAYGWHLYDIAAALMECQFDDDADAMQSAFLTGYRANRPLPDAEIDRLPDFLLIRSMAVIGWYLQRPEYAGADSMEPFKDWVVEESARRGF